LNDVAKTKDLELQDKLKNKKVETVKEAI